MKTKSNAIVELQSMGKCLTSLLILVNLFFSLDSFGSDQVRQVQEELRRRHLFHNHTDGHITPAFIHALKRYQARKGFEPTGVIDSQTAGSLGIISFTAPAPPPAAVHPAFPEPIGPNGEAFPRAEHETGWLADAPAEDDVARELPRGVVSTEWADMNAGPGGLTTGTDDAVDPLDVEFELTNERLHRRAQGDLRGSLALAAMRDRDWLSGAKAESSEQASKQRRRSRKSVRRPRPQKETNPLVLAYQSVDRLVKNLFDDDGREAKKRLRGKRG